MTWCACPRQTPSRVCNRDLSRQLWAAFGIFLGFAANVVCIHSEATIPGGFSWQALSSPLCLCWLSTWFPNPRDASFEPANTPEMASHSWR